jgi:hypothetical protein
MSWGMTSHVHCIIGKDRYRVALPSDRRHHWRAGHESPVCIALDNTHLYCDYDQCRQQCGCGIPSQPQATSYHCHHVQVGGSLSRVCLASGCFLGHPLVSGGVSLSGSLSQGESSSLGLLIFGTRESMRLDRLRWYLHLVLCIFRKNTNMPSTPHSQIMSEDMLSGLTSVCRGIDINCLCKAETFWW